MKSSSSCYFTGYEQQTIMHDSTDGLEDFVVGDITTAIAVRLRQEHLYHFIRSRDDLLRLERDDDSETIRILRRQSLRGLEKTWNSILRALRDNLPMMLDQLLDKLQPEFQATGSSPSRSFRVTPSTPAPVSVDFPRPVSRVLSPRILRSLESEASVAGSSILSSGRDGSATIGPEFRAANEVEGISPVTGTEPGVIDLANKPTEKRPLPRDEAESRSPKKKAKRTTVLNVKSLETFVHKPIKRNIFLREVEQQECIFSYSEYPGFYVLRCNLVKCKKALDQDEGTIFKSHPFRNGLAEEHFAEEWHNIKSETEIFRRFAIRVIDADSERNTEKNEAKPAGKEPVPTRAVELTKLTTAKLHKLKGKQIEQPWRLYPKLPDEEASTSRSAEHANETFRESFYRAGTLLSIAESAPLSDKDDRDSPDPGTGRQTDAERDPTS